MREHMPSAAGDALTAPRESSWADVDVALEQAQLFARLGSQVTVLVRSRLASKEEPEVSRTLQEVFADEGIRVVRRALPTRVSRDAATGQAVVTAVDAEDLAEHSELEGVPAVEGEDGDVAQHGRPPGDGTDPAG